MTKKIRTKALSKIGMKRKSKSSSSRGPRPAAANYPGGKLGLIVERLKADRGATLADLAEVTGWQKHTVRGALSRLRARGLAIQHETGGSRKAYRLTAGRS